MKKLTIILLLLSGLSGFCQDSIFNKYAEGISLQELKEHVKILASTEFEGRGTGEKGQHMASKYLKEQFIEAGLKGASKTGDPYYQEFNLKKSGGVEIEIVCGDSTLSSNTNLAIAGTLATLNDEYEVVFVGYGVDEEVYSDYKDIDVKGKAVVFLAGEPKNNKGTYLLSSAFMPKYTDRGKTKSLIALEKGAVLSFRIDLDTNRIARAVNRTKHFSEGGQLSLIDDLRTNDLTGSGLIHIGINDAATLLNTKQALLEKTQVKLNKGKSQSGIFSNTVMINISQGTGLIETENIVAYLEGNEFKDEIIVITAHFDHLGMRNDNIYHGADDNSTGTAAVIEIAEAFAQLAADGIRPKRSILFMPVTGEERGLLGSKYYVKNPLYPLKKTAATINMDMIGRSDKHHDSEPNYVYVYISDTQDSRLAKLAQLSGESIKGSLVPEFKYKKDLDYKMSGSDHASFEKVEIPVMYFYCGTHADYHRPSDTWEKIEYEKLTEITRLVFFSALNLANGDIN